MRTLPLFICAAFLAQACNGSLDAFSEKVDIDGTLPHEMIILGDRLEDPYTVENMTKAAESLYSTKADRGSISTTDLYVRFLPSSQEQFELLEDLGVQMLDHPMDYEILKEGDYYCDPDIPEDSITWQYAVVPKSFAFPDEVRYELIDECFLPENSSTKADWIDWEAVERTAFELTGNADLLSPSTKAGGSRPSGRITIVDSRLGSSEIGVKGVTVSCNIFVKTAHAYTDEDGYYSMTKSFNGTPRYRLMFKNKKGFGIGFNLLLVPASCSTLGKADPAGVDLKIDENSERKLFSRAVVNNTGYEYYESCKGDDCSIKTPPANLRIWLFQNLDKSSAVMLQQGAIVDDSSISKYLGIYSSLLKMFLPDLTLGLKSAETYADIYATTVHELAHASHFMQVGTDYWNEYVKYIAFSYLTSGFVTYGAGTEENHGYCEVGEMWAYYLQTKMVNERYSESKEYGVSYWFYPQIFTKLDDKGIDRYRIFNALTNDVCDKDALQKKLVSLYPQSKSIINQAFGKYN